MLFKRLIKSIGVGILIIAVQGAGAAEEQAPPTLGEYFARIDDHVISRDRFQQALREGARNRYYHGSVPAGELATFEREVADELIDAYLLDREAQARGVEADAESVAAKLDTIDQRNQGNPRWSEVRDQVLETLEARYQRESRVEQLERQVRTIEHLPEAEVRAYYEANPDKFTQPVANRLGVILLGVDPAAGGEAWQTAQDKAKALVEQLKAGADFGELAQLHSVDQTADQGGDMGVVHAGMIAEEAQTQIDELAVGEISEPVVLLDGVAIFKVLDRQPAELQPFEQVKGRATDLLKRERADLAWESLIFRLRQGAEIELNQALFSADPNQR